MSFMSFSICFFFFALRFSLRKTGSHLDISSLTGLAIRYHCCKFHFLIVVFGSKSPHLLLRCNHQVGDPKEVSPIIDQFLECVWQLMEQYPCAFEFNERFLITIHSHIYSCQYGNFIGNNQRERIELG